jgi:hypothetical protein
MVAGIAGAGPDDAPGLFVSLPEGQNSVLSNAGGLTVNDSTIRGTYGKYVIVEGLYPRHPREGILTATSITSSR